jgi:hypothetical protein
MNKDIKELHAALLAQHQTLYKKLDGITDPAQAKVVLTEMQEILHRVDMLQGLLFSQTTGALTQSVQKVQEADVDLGKAFDEAKSAGDFVKSVSTYLTYVDEAIDLAKTLAA